MRRQTDRRTTSRAIKTGSEPGISQKVHQILDTLSLKRFGCRERKNSGISAIGKPVDLEVYFVDEPKRVVVAIEVANVNTTQLVGETCRLYYDSCPLKLLVLGNRNVPANGKDQCEKLLAKLYGQDDIRYTPARVVRYDDETGIKRALKELLLI